MASRSHKFDDIGIVQQSVNRWAGFTAGISANKAYCIAQWLPSDSVSCLTHGLAWNSRKAKDVTLTLHRGNGEFQEVFNCQTNMAGDVPLETTNQTLWRGTR